MPGRCVLAVVLSALAGNCLAQQPSVKRTLSLAGRIQVPLTSDWVKRIDIDPPPASPLLASSPEFGFTDFLVLENRAEPAVVEIGLSGNPFLGKDAVWVDTEIHRSFLATLFYLFFPPPRGCLVRAQSAFAVELRKKEEEAEAAESGEKSKEKPRNVIGPISVSEPCVFSVTALDLFARELSAVIHHRGTRAEQHIQPTLRDFYLSPMEQLEIGRNTFFIFEARADHLLQLSDVQQFGLPDNRQGARAHFFWAIGAVTPFPFVRDPQRKDLQIFHIVYASLALNGEAGEQFHALLRSMEFGP